MVAAMRGQGKGRRDGYEPIHPHIITMGYIPGQNGTDS